MASLDAGFSAARERIRSVLLLCFLAYADVSPLYCGFGAVRPRAFILTVVSASLHLQVYAATVQKTCTHRRHVRAKDTVAKAIEPPPLRAHTIF